MASDLNNNKIFYWVSQVAGWLTYVTLIGVLIQISGSSVDSTVFLLNLLSICLIGIGMSHFYRYLVLKWHWLKLNIGSIIPRVLVASLLFGVICHVLQAIISEVLIAGNPLHAALYLDLADVFQKVINWTVLFLVWSLFYFLVHFIQNYRREEIKNLRWQAAKNEIELNKLKSQLNPHFIFNSMNSIRALINEDPDKAKDSVTRLSNILRNSLQMSKNKVIEFKEELRLITDYLELEKTRYEERLTYNLNVADESLSTKVPPMMVQTLVENAIKHGVSKLPGGGNIELVTKVEGDMHYISIINDGSISRKEDKPGFGLENTRQRLQLLYGSNATFDIKEEKDKVIAELVIPKTLNHEA